MLQNSLKRDAASIVDGEFAFSGEDFRKIAAMLHADAGIYLPDAKATLVYSRRPGGRQRRRRRATEDAGGAHHERHSVLP